MNKDLKTLATFGIMWTGISQFSTQVFQLVVIIILARLLSPQDFGIIGIATVFIGFVAIFNELGLSAAIIQRRDVNELHLSTSFWSNIFVGIIMFIFTLIISPFVATFFQEEIIRPILIISSISLIIGPLGIVHRALLEKNLDFKNITVVEICTAFVSGTISIVLALTGFGVWSIVYGNISGSIISIIVLWKISNWKPSLKFSIPHLKELFRFGGNVTGSKIIAYIIVRMDFLVVGKMFGTVALGYYTLARNLTSFPVQKISWAIMRVTFPTFSKIQKDNDMLRKGYLKVIKYVSLITFPMLAGLFVVASEFILVVYGEKWSPMVILLQIFSIGGALVSIGAIESTILFSKGRSDLQFKLQIYSAILMFIAVIIGVNFGMIGMAIAVTIMTAFSLLIFQIVVNKLIKLDMFTFIKEIIPAAVCSTILIIGVEIYKRTIFVDSIQLIYMLLSSIFIGMIVYIILIRVLYNNILGEIFNEIKLLLYKIKMKG